jgi:hypothetical protein
MTDQAFSRVLLLTVAAATTSRAQLPSPLFVSDGDAPAGFSAAVVLDLDQDGDADGIDILGRTILNDGNGRFSIGPSMPPLGSSGQYHAIGVGDFDGDGLQDLVEFVPVPSVGGSSFAGFRRGVGGFLAPIPAAAAPVLPSGSTVGSVLVADFDLNGLDDLLVSFVGSNPAPPTIRLYLASGPFAFAPPAAAATAALAPFGRAFAVDDFNNDGVSDILATTSYIVPNGAPPPAAPQILLSSGVSFVAQPAAPMALGPAIEVVVPGDFDGDGDLDVLVDQQVAAAGGATSGQLVFLSGDGAGGLAVGGTFPIAGSTSAFAGHAIDVDGDGASEYLRRAGFFWTTYDVSLAGPPLPLQSGRTILYAPGSLPASSFQQQFLGTADDFDGDGDRDFLILGPDGVLELRRNDASGLLRSAPRVLPAEFRAAPGAHVCDADRDGDIDVVGPTGSGFGTVAIEPRTATNDGFGTFSAPPGGPSSVASLNAFTPTAVGDFDGDGDLDFALYTQSLSLAIYRNDGAAGWTSIPAPAASCDQLAAADLDGDGADELILAARGGTGPVVLFGGANWGAQFGPIGPTPSGDLVVADFDFDGDLDLFDGAFYDNSGAGALNPAATAAPAPVVYFAAAGDLDGDGDLDLVVDGNVFLRGPAGFTAVSPIPLLPTSAGFQFGDLVDLDGDGTLDLLGGSAWYRGLGGGAFAPAEVVAPSRVYAGVETSAAFPRGRFHAGDLDGDGDLDLVDDNKRVYLNRRRHCAPGSPARLGRVGTLELGGPPGAIAEVIVATSRAAAPIAAGPWGFVFVEPSAAALLTAFVLDASGSATLALAVPNVPSLVGLSLFWQCAFPLEGRLSGLAQTPVVGF